MGKLLNDSSKKVAEELENKVKISNDEKRILPVKHENLSAEFKHLKSENEDIRKENINCCS